MAQPDFNPPEPPEVPADAPPPLVSHDEDDPEQFAGDFIPDPWEN